MTRNVPLTWIGWLVAATGLYFALVATLFPSLSETIFFLSPDHGAADLDRAGMDIVLALTGVFGGVMIGWGITIVTVAKHFTRAARNHLAIAVVAWYLTDSLASLENHLAYNAILNTGFLALALAALTLGRAAALVAPDSTGASDRPGRSPS